MISSRDNRLHHIVRRISNFLPTFFAIPFLVSNPFSYNKRIIIKKLDFLQLIKNQKPANFIKGLEALKLSMESKNEGYFMEDFFLHCNEVTLKLNQVCKEDKFTSTFNHKKLNEFLIFID